MYYCTVYPNLTPSPSIDLCLGKNMKKIMSICSCSSMLHNVLIVWLSQSRLRGFTGAIQSQTPRSALAFIHHKTVGVLKAELLNSDVYLPTCLPGQMDRHNTTGLLSTFIGWAINPFMLNGLSDPHQLDKSISDSRVVGWYFFHFYSNLIIYFVSK